MRIKKVRRSTCRFLAEALENRQMLSAINWVNRGQTSDGFDSVFGTGTPANAARGVLDAVIESWQRAIVNFNYPGGGDTYNITISMAAKGTSTGANAGPTHYTSDGKPDQGTMTIGRGGDKGTDGLGDGVGYYLDTTALESSEFTLKTTNAYTAYAAYGSAPYGLADLYDITLHEMGHAMGFTNSTQMNKFVTNTGVLDTIDSNLDSPKDNPAVGHYYRFDGPDVKTLLTSFDSGGQSGGATDFGSPDHFAPPAQV